MHRPPDHIDQSLVLAYEQTHYYLPALTITVRVGQYVTALDDWLSARNAWGGIFITAYNPGSDLHSEDTNIQRQADLKAMLTQSQLAFITAIHRDPTGQWPDEMACFVIDIELEEALSLGRYFGQNAVVVYNVGEGAHLCWCRM